MKKINSIKFGCFQGRLTQPWNGNLQCFPRYNWEKELTIASNCNLDFVEILAERIHNPNNPIWSNEGNNLIRKAILNNKLEAYSACLDYTIENSLFNNNIKSNEVLDYAINFSRRLKNIGIKYFVLPLLEKSDPNLFSFNEVIDTLMVLINECKKLDIAVLVETNLDAEKLFKYLDRIDIDSLGCVFDTGNKSNILDVNKEILILSRFIKHIHLKDKRNNSNVLLGTGTVDFLLILETLNQISYKGSFCFETNRGKEPINTMKHNLNFMKFLAREIQ